MNHVKSLPWILKQDPNLLERPNVVNIFWRIFWIQHIHCLFSSLCVVVSEFGRNMKFNRKKNHTAGLRLPKLTEVVCMQLNILVWTMIDCNYNPHKNMPTFYSNHLSTFKVEQIIIKTLLLQENKACSVSLYLIYLIVSLQYSQLLLHQQHGAQLVDSGQHDCVTILSAHDQDPLSANERPASAWSDQSEQSVTVCGNVSPLTG